MQLEFLRERWKREAADSHENWTRSNARRVLFNLMSLGGALVVAALAGASIPNSSFSTYIRVATLVVSVVAAIGTTGARVLRPQDTGLAARVAYVDLKGLGWRFLTKGNSDAEISEFADFADAV